MAVPFRVVVDALPDSDVPLSTYNGSLHHHEEIGDVRCPHCKKLVGVLICGTPSRRDDAARSLLVVDPAQLARVSKRVRSLELVAPQVWKECHRPFVDIGLTDEDIAKRDHPESRKLPG